MDNARNVKKNLLLTTLFFLSSNFIMSQTCDVYESAYHENRSIPPNTSEYIPAKKIYTKVKIHMFYNKTGELVIIGFQEEKSGVIEKYKVNSVFGNDKITMVIFNPATKDGIKGIDIVPGKVKGTLDYIKTQNYKGGVLTNNIRYKNLKMLSNYKWNEKKEKL